MASFAAAGAVSSPSVLQRHISLTRELAWTQFKLRYTGSVLGYVWSLIKPLMLFTILYVIFVVFFHQRSNEFALQLLTAIVVFQFFTECVSGAMASIVANGNLIRKAAFPRSILVIASSLTALLTFAINFTLIMVVATLLGHLHPGIRTLVLPLLLVQLYALSLGLGLFLAAVYVFYRDIGHMWDIASQVIFYLSGVVFPYTVVPERFRHLFFLNPIAQIIEDVRHAVVLPVLPWTVILTGVLPYLASLGLTVATVLLGLWVFRRLTPSFAENL